MKLLGLLCLLVYFLSTIQAASGLQSQLSTSKLTELISPPIITAIYRDHSGSLWIGTQDGLYKFDGADSTFFNADENNRNRLPVSEIRGISEDSEGNLLIAMYGGGLAKWDAGSNMFVSSTNMNSAIDYINRLYISKRGNIWLGTSDRLFLHNSASRNLDEWLSSPIIAKQIGRPYAFVENKLGALFVGSDRGLIRILALNETIESYDLSSLQSDKAFAVTALALDESDIIFIGTDTGYIAKINTNTGKLETQTKVAADTSLLITNLAIYRDHLIVATDKGLFSSDKELSQLKDISKSGSGLSNADIHSLHLDGSQLWIGTYNGLDLLSLAPFELMNYRNSAVNNEPLTFIQDDFGRIWIGTYDGLYVYDEASGGHQRIGNFDSSTGLQDQRITALEKSDNLIWLGYLRGGFQTFDIATGRISTPEVEDSDEMSVSDILANRDTGDIWIATMNHGLIRIKNQRYQYYKETSSLNEKGITKLSYREGQLLLVSKSNRIYVYDEKSDHFSPINIDFGYATEKILILTIAQDERGNIWIGTKNRGVFKWGRSNQERSNFRVTQLAKGSIIEFSTIYAIEIDSDGDLWCSTQNGIVKLNPEGQLIKRFTTADGLQGNDFTLGASFKSSEGLMYFGGTNGYNRFNPDEIEVDSEPSPMRLTGISLPSKDKRDLGEIAGLKSLQLTHNDRFVTFQFSVLDLIDPERNQFRYTLENFDSEWIESGSDNSATYTNLPAGDYVFRAQGANSAGIWNVEGIEVSVNVLPAPWRTWWAYTLYWLAFFCLLWAIVRIYRSYAIDRESAQLALEMFEAENKADDYMQEHLEFQDELVRSAYEHSQRTLGLVSDSIRLRTSPHETDINYDLADITLKRIAALSGLEDCLSYHAGGPVANLYQYTDSIIPGLLEHAPVSSETIVTINDVTSLPIPAELASPISIVIYELVENCIQHAFQKDSPANYIHIKMIPGSTKEPHARCYELTIHDSGSGLPDSIENLARYGGGLATVIFIVKNLCGDLEAIQGSGTTICLTVPSIDTP